MIVDSHAHVSPIWYEPVEALLCQMDRYGVERAVLTQMIGQTDNSYQSACVKRYPTRFTSVVWVDVDAPDVVSTIERHAQEGASGIRLRPAVHAANKALPSAWAAAAACGLAISCVGNSAAFADAGFTTLLKALPEISVVLEHLGATSTAPSTEAEIAARRNVFALAALPNVMLKLPGFGEVVTRSPSALRDGRPFGEGLPAAVADALVVFGPERLMWGSDFPVVGSREGYGQSLGIPRAALGCESDSALAAIFGGNALRVFGPR
ncbi:amidohydrolase family protein [Pandoraea oxalativorans]|uniref:Amidohydrolase n=1 Tax=Pandoraea oxalativorans TaxID=573737 RepID=A0A0E3U5S2_9BURK|nr:amidohydrolase family protein [Pandoraea oxalativorans]AKC69449.1 amidohydrolase [Pandoraea oxalativorans]